MVLRKLFPMLVVLSFLAFTQCSQSNGKEKLEFQEALAIWPMGQQYEKNITIEFQGEFETPKAKQAFLRITGSSLYRIYLNDEFIGHGPARAGHGYYRVDEWDLSKYLKDSNNLISIEVVGYNVNSYYLLDQPSFVQAEVVSNNKILVATTVEENDFVASQMKERVQKVPRYSFQRPFIEYYKIGLEGKVKLEVENVGPKKLIARRIPYPDFEIVRPLGVVANGTVQTGIKREQYWRDRAVVNVGPKLGGFVEDELEYNPAIELQEMENLELSPQSTEHRTKHPLPSNPLRDRVGEINLQEKEFQILDMGTNLTGFIGAEIEVHEPTRLFITFDEVLQNGDVNFKRLGTIAALTYDLCVGDSTCHPGLDLGSLQTGKILNLESIEPYTFRYLKIIVAKGSCTIKDVYLREFANPDIKRASFTSSDERLNRIYDAGVETFRQNAVDIFMDCPHRERAGWLCDSYFTARVAKDISGNTLVEKNFLENYLLPASFDFLPKGMLPMCYPADHNDSVFIPNWAMWFVVELEEYLDRSLDRQLIDDLEPKVMGLLDYFKAFQNEDGLLESLESWIFVEWSKANSFVQDVNYPTNMLYAKMLDVAGKLYKKPELVTQARELRNTIREQSWNGEFFVDNAIRVKGRAHDQETASLGQGIALTLQPTRNTTEVCQYYAFYFNVANPETHPELWTKLSTEFGPKRQEQDLYPEVHPANSFIGNYLRLELLSQYNLRSQLLEESIDFFDYMAQETGTLWENIGTYASCNHGFASHVVHMLYRDVLGIEKVDIKNSELSFQFSDLPLDKCEGQIPVGDEIVKLAWEKRGNELHIDYTLPAGFSVTLKNNTSLKLIDEHK